MFQLSQGTFHPSFWKHCSGLLKHFVGAIQFAQVPLNSLVDLTQFLAQLATGVVLGLGIDRLKSAAIDSDDVTVQKVHIAAQDDELLAHFADCRAFIFAEIGNRLEVWPQPTR